MTPFWLDVVVGVCLVVALAGTILPVLPGPVLAAGAVAVWGVVEGGAWGWGVAVAAVVLVVIAMGLKYLIPAAWMRQGGVPSWVLLVGAIGGVVGFFVIPVIGVLVGFVLGVFLAELGRLRSASKAWPTTVTAMKAAGLSTLIDLAAVLLVGAAWAAVLTGQAVLS